MNEQEILILNQILKELQGIREALVSPPKNPGAEGLKNALLEITSTLPPEMQKMMRPLFSQLK